MLRALYSITSLLVCLLFVGCQAEEGITQYQVPRENQALAQRLRVAIVKTGDQNNWFFKLVGAPETLALYDKEFDAFVQSIRIKDNKPEWELPRGWSEVPGPPMSMRYKTLRLTTEKETPLDLTVSQAKGDLLANINRWRRQDLHLPEFATEADLKAAKPPILGEIPVGDTRVTLVDMVGTKPRRSGGMGMTPPRGPAAETRAASSLSFQVPDSWKQTQPPSGFIPIDYAFRISPDSPAPEVTITQMPNVSPATWKSNLDRWRGQVELKPLDEAPRDQPTLKVDGKDYPYVDFAGPQKRLLVVVCENKSISWYIKVFGPADLVSKNKEAFESFVKSIRFDPDAGAKP